jgi:hypothetical protein
MTMCVEYLCARQWHCSLQTGTKPSRLPHYLFLLFVPVTSLYHTSNPVSLGCLWVLCSNQAFTVIGERYSSVYQSSAVTSACTEEDLPGSFSSTQSYSTVTRLIDCSNNGERKDGAGQPTDLVLFLSPYIYSAHLLSTFTCNFAHCYQHLCERNG